MTPEFLTGFLKSYTRFKKVNNTISRKKCQQQTELYLLPYTEIAEKREATGVHFPEEK